MDTRRNSTSTPGPWNPPYPSHPSQSSQSSQPHTPSTPRRMYGAEDIGKDPYNRFRTQQAERAADWYAKPAPNQHAPYKFGKIEQPANEGISGQVDNGQIPYKKVVGHENDIGSPVSRDESKESMQELRRWAYFKEKKRDKYLQQKREVMEESLDAYDLQEARRAAQQAKNFERAQSIRPGLNGYRM